jgi:hypothetical protein
VPKIRPNSAWTPPGTLNGWTIRLHGEARRGPVVTSSATLAAYLTTWLEEVVGPNLAPLTYSTYATHVRLYLVPGLGTERLDKLTVRRADLAEQPAQRLPVLRPGQGRPAT